MSSSFALTLAIFQQQIFEEKSFCRWRQKVFKISFEKKRLFAVHQINFERRRFLPI
jgi:hypothetical protein